MNSPTSLAGFLSLAAERIEQHMDDEFVLLVSIGVGFPGLDVGVSAGSSFGIVGRLVGGLVGLGVGAVAATLVTIILGGVIGTVHALVSVAAFACVQAVRSVWGDAGSRSEAASGQGLFCHGWRIAVLATCMAPAARQRWLEHIAEALHDFEPEDHPALLESFRRKGLVVIMRSWTVDFTRRGAS